MDKPNECLVWRAVVQDDLEFARELIALGENVDECEIQEGRPCGDTALIHAAFNDKPEWVSFLLAAGACADIVDAAGLTPLACACLSGSARSAKLLIASGCKLDEEDNDGETAVMLAAMEGSAEIVGMLLEAGCSLDKFDENGGILGSGEKYYGRVNQCAQMIAAEKERRDLERRVGAGRGNSRPRSGAL